MAEQNLLSKISVAKCHGKIDAGNLPSGPILRVVGVATGTKTGPDKNKPGEFWTALVGDFVAVNILTGEEYRAGVCFMPSSAQNAVLGALSGSPDGVEFAFDFGVKKSSVPVGYEYTVKPVVKAKDSEAMTNLLARVNEAAPLAIGVDKGNGKSKGK